MKLQNQTFLLPPKAPAIYKYSLIFLLIFFGSMVFMVIGFAITKDPPFAILAIFDLLFAILTITAAYQTRKSYQMQGLWFLLLAIWVSFQAYTLQVSSFGWVGFIGIPLISILIIEQCIEDRKQKQQLILFSVLFGLSSLLLEFIAGRERIPLSGIVLSLPAFISLALPFIFVGAFREFSNYSLRTKLLVFFLGVSTVPLVVLGYINYSSANSNLIDSANLSLVSAADDTAQEIDNFFDTTLKNLQTETRLPAIRDILTAPADERTAIMEADAQATLTILENKDSQNILGYYLLDRQGALVVSYPPQLIGDQTFLGLDTDTVSFLRTAILTEIPHVTTIKFSSNGNGSSFFVASRVGTESGSPLGLLVAQYDASLLQDLIDEQYGLAGPQSYPVLLDEYNFIIGHGENTEYSFHSLSNLESRTYLNLRSSGRIPGLGLEELSLGYNALTAELTASDEPGRTFAVDNIENPNETDQVAISSMNNRPWIILFIQPQSIFLSPVQTQGLIVFAIISGFVVLVILSAFTATRFLANPIVNLTQVAEKFSSGNLDNLAPVGTTDEIGLLGQSLNIMAVQLREMISGLEDQVRDRTSALERQANQIQVAAEVARDSISERDLTRLLNHTVDLISDRFGFYHAGIFLIDANREYAVLQAANSPGGKEMLANHHRLRVGEVGIVGYATGTGNPRIALDVGEDAVHFRNPYLPQTRSEMSIPIVSGSQVIGALDVQSKQESAFDEKDISVLQIVADQLGIAIQNASLLADMEKALREAEIASGKYTADSWKEYSKSIHSIKGYRLDAMGLQESHAIPQTSKASLETGEIVQTDTASEELSTTEVAIPIRLRDQVIGVINLAFDGPEVDPETLDIISVLNDRLALALENARLLDETRNRANLERVAGEISSRIRSTLDIDSVLETALREIQQTLGVDEVEARLGAIHPGFGSSLGNLPDPMDTNWEADHGE